MEKVINWLRLAAVFSICIGFTCGTSFSKGLPAKKNDLKRPDLIIIDSLKTFGRLEQSPVAFLHDAHVAALAKKNMSAPNLVCSSCHVKKKDQFSPGFQRTEDTDKITVMNLYHKECISCHGEMRLKKEKAGPVECGECHALSIPYVSDRAEMGFDRSLHYRHSKANENKCEKCHHAYDENKKALFYDKGKEGSCRYCHEKQTVDNRVSMQTASHTACLDCHLKTGNDPDTHRPVTCAACHDKKEQLKIKKSIEIPRMERHQPDQVLLRASANTGMPAKTDSPVNRMAFVPFNHKAHENANDTCRVCHHNSMQPCNECHVPGGPAKESEAGLSKKQALPLDKAMHLANSDQSCVGCHNKAKQQINCAGCHDFISPVKPMQKSTCDTCHAIPVEKAPMVLDKSIETGVVLSALEAGKALKKEYPADQIPETVTIQTLSHQYQPVRFPHRKVVTAIAARISDNALSGFFHGSGAALCQGCHHNSPASQKPPRCSSCHGKQWDTKELTKPGILGAFHQQCMGCHKRMKIEKPMGCTECHELKRPNR